ncbi:MAG: hypothetical protein CL916_07035 [Deltaproteobacteria bacterium]|nr:hypothetical protein [Deltaproteobacteria bacterium]
MKCSACDRISSANRKKCMYCGGALVQDKRSGSIQCCGCLSVMEEVEIEGVFVNICSNCGGIWFDVGELETLIERTAIREFHALGISQECEKMRTLVQSKP